MGDLECGAFLRTFPGITNGSNSNVRADPASLETMAQNFAEPRDTAALTRGGRAPRPVSVSTTSVSGKEDTAFVADDFPLPIDNPFQRWMGPRGFDFTPDDKATVVAMRSGDVWWVEGLMRKAPSTLRWRRIASGLFEPLGVRFRDGKLFVICREQLAKLVDLNRDGETDFIECFNDDAQVTEHFHEFAMGLPNRPSNTRKQQMLDGLKRPESSQLNLRIIRGNKLDV